MNATRLIEEWRRQGRVLEVEGANTILWRPLFVFMGFPHFWLSLSKASSGTSQPRA